MGNERSIATLLVWLIFIGFLVIFVGFTLVMIAILASNGQVSFGGIIIVGPIPIIVGYGQEAPWLVLLALILTVTCLVIFATIWRKR